MRDTASYWIRHLGLQEHPNCSGYFKEVHRSGISVAGPSGQPRSSSTSIYFLQRGDQRTKLHKIKSDEYFIFNVGGNSDARMVVYYLKPETKSLVKQVLGTHVQNGETLQAIVPAGCFMCSQLEGSHELTDSDFALVSILVSPGFDFQDDSQGEKGELLKQYPEYKEFIEKFT